MDADFAPSPHFAKYFAEVVANVVHHKRNKTAIVVPAFEFVDPDKYVDAHAETNQVGAMHGMR